MYGPSGLKYESDYSYFYSRPRYRSGKVVGYGEVNRRSWARTHVYDRTRPWLKAEKLRTWWLFFGRDQETPVLRSRRRWRSGVHAYRLPCYRGHRT